MGLVPNQPLSRTFRRLVPPLRRQEIEVLYGANGLPLYVPPTPNDLTEERVNEELRSIDSLLSIRWMPIVYQKSPDVWEGRYALCFRWPESDPRWGTVPEGYDEPYDILCWFCEDMHNGNSVPMDPESIMGLVRNFLGKCDNSRFPWRDRMKKTVEKNERHRAKIKQEASDEVDWEYSYWHSNRATRVFQYQGGKR